jgi:hypothetical protein
MARKVERREILDYQTYSEQRDGIRAAVLEQKKPRRVHVGGYLTFLFENHDTVRYQIQEMMRAEQIVKEEAIVHEIDTYNELLGEDGAIGGVLLIEIDDPAERAVKLKEWLPLVEHLYAELEDGTRVRATYDPRQVGEERLSSVQYLKFDTGGQVPVALGSDLPALTVQQELDAAQREALRADLAE